MYPLAEGPDDRYLRYKLTKEFAFVTIPIDAPETLNREFLPIRAKLLEIAAALDRLERAEGSVDDDRRMQWIRAAMAVIADGEPARAERLQMVFSLPYQAGWIDTFHAERERTG
jgi:hypothetical protein